MVSPDRSSRIELLAAALLLALTGCNPSPPPPAAQQQPGTPFEIYRFDDHFATAATVAAANAPSSVRLAERVAWEFDDQKITWDLVRGRMGFKKGQLIVKGEGSSPVIISPVRPPIDWSRYEALVIRMVAEGGSEIKIKVDRDRELRQPLAPKLEWKVYRFDLGITEAGFTRPIAIMPTDDLFAPVAIDYIELVPRKQKFATAAGLASIGKREEYRNAIFAHAPSTISYEIPVPKNAVLRFATGVSSKSPVTFRVTEGASNELFTRTMSDPEVWDEAEVDLGRYAGRTARLAFRTESEARDATGLWANPIMLTRSGARRPNVLFYVVCTLRPDHTSVYGYPKPTTPFLKRFAEEGIVFDDATAQAPWTKPSVASMMTSLHAYTHGLVNDADTIPKTAETLAGRLRAGGYVTASIVANPFAGRTSGLDRGFDFMMEYPVIQRNRTDEVDRGTDSAAINRAIFPWIDRHKDEPFFLFVQSTDPHAPYRPPADFEARFANPAETPAFNKHYAALRDIRAYGGGATVTRAEMKQKGIDPDTYARQAVERYDAEIAHNDASIEALIGKLRQSGVLDNTIVVIASDHGEEFWEHGFGAHGHSLYSELIRTVLLMWNPRLLPGAKRVSEPVQMIDIMPTLLEVLGQPLPETVQGQSLVPLLNRKGFSRTGAVWASKLALPQAKPGGGVPENLTDTIVRIEPAWKLIYRAQAGKARMKEVELYQRSSDRGDTKDVAGEHADVAERMKREVIAWIAGQREIRKHLGQGAKSTLDPKTLERLRSLGYLGGRTQKEK